MGDYHQLLKLNGIWYEVRAEKINSNVVKNAIKYGWAKIIGPKDRIISSNGNKDYHYYYWTVRVTYKKQLNSFELKKYGLKNDIVPVKYGRLK